MDHEISARQKRTTISWSKSFPESSDLGTMCGGKQTHSCILRAFQRVPFSEKLSLSPVTRPGGPSGPQLTARDPLPGVSNLLSLMTHSL